VSVPTSGDIQAVTALNRKGAGGLRFLVLGHTNAEIATLCDVSLRTVEARRARLLQKLGVRTRAELVRVARQSGLIRTDHPEARGAVTRRCGAGRRETVEEFRRLRGHGVELDTRVRNVSVIHVRTTMPANLTGGVRERERERKRRPHRQRRGGADGATRRRQVDHVGLELRQTETAVLTVTVAKRSTRNLGPGAGRSPPTRPGERSA